MDAPIEATPLPALLDSFYSRVRTDAELGPLCALTPETWPVELKTLAELWPELMSADSGRLGIPGHESHKRRSPITVPMFERWLSLWRQTAGELLPPDGATAMQVKAARLSMNLQRALGLCRAEA